MRHHPADDIAAEDIQNHIEMEVGPLTRSVQFGDVPGPQLVGLGGQQFGLGVVGMAQLVAAVSDLGMVMQDALEGTNRTSVGANT